MAKNGGKEAEWIWMEKLERGHTVREKEDRMEELRLYPMRATLGAHRMDDDDDDDFQILPTH